MAMQQGSNAVRRCVALMPNDLNMVRPDEGHGDCVKSKNVAQ